MPFWQATCDQLLRKSTIFLPGALLKAAFICAEVIDMKSEISLTDQLMLKYGGGFELHSWTNLPHGSGEFELHSLTNLPHGSGEFELHSLTNLPHGSGDFELHSWTNLPHGSGEFSFLILNPLWTGNR